MLLASHLLLLVLVLVFRKSWNLNLVIMVSAGKLLAFCAFSSLPAQQQHHAEAYDAQGPLRLVLHWLTFDLMPSCPCLEARRRFVESSTKDPLVRYMSELYTLIPFTKHVMPPVYLVCQQLCACMQLELCTMRSGSTPICGSTGRRLPGSPTLMSRASSSALLCPRLFWSSCWCSWYADSLQSHPL